MTDGYPPPGTPMRVGHMSEVIGSLSPFGTRVNGARADAAEPARLDAWAGAAAAYDALVAAPGSVRF
ncbi:hypothetical protein [Streptomyces virginiae]|uniref:hypothetical protein n=1 Tax=Streptomyces virginiae TaxID=1961 RepID=UPI0036FF7962